MKKGRRAISAILILVLLIGVMSGCGGTSGGTGGTTGGGASSGGTSVKLDPANPTTITVWHYYGGAVMGAFDRMLKEFNETVGLEQGIIVQGSSMGSVNDLQAAVLASAKKEVGSLEMPNIFASYADTAYVAEQMGILADLDQYFTEAELDEYILAYIDEGRIGSNNELKIFPIAKSTEILMINETDWTPFATECGFTFEDMATPESLAIMAKAYYEWTDAKTPETANDGRAFYGRDAMANMFIIGSMQLGVEVINVDAGEVTINVDEAVMRRIWDTYYIPYISGYYLSVGRYRSDDTKVGLLVAYVGSTSSAMYFPSEVTIDGDAHPVEVKILPAPIFAGGANVMVQQGAGMTVTKSTPEKEYASAVFLKWFTDTDSNVQFSALSGYMPVKQAANDYELFMGIVEENGISQDDISKMTLEVAFGAVNSGLMYTSKAFGGGTEARDLLNNLLQAKAAVDRAAVLELIVGGATHDEAVSQFDTDANFEAWYADLDARIQATATQG